MGRFTKRRRRHSPVPPAPEESSSASTSPDVLASVIKGFDVMEKAVDGLPILGLVKPVIYIVGTVLKSVEVKIFVYLRLG